MADDDIITETNDECVWEIWPSDNDIFQEAAIVRVNDDIEYSEVDMDGFDGVLSEHLNDPDYSKHNLILKEIINEQGLLVESYYCQECFVEYNDINEFLRQHPGVELLNENPEEGEEGVDIKSEGVDIKSEEKAPIEEETAIEEKATIEEEMTMDEETTIEEEAAIKEETAIEEDGTIEKETAIEGETTIVEETRDKLWELVENIRDDNEDDVLADLVKSVEGEAEHATNMVTKTETLDSEGERYFCYECQQVFTDLKSAEEHDCTQPLIDEEEKDDQEEELSDLACSYCRQEYQTYDELLTHIPNCDENATSLLTSKPSKLHCDLCNKDYPNIRSYNGHQRLHRRIKKIKETGPVKCEICNTNFESPKNLKLHMKMHNERSLKSIQEALPAGAQLEYNQLNQFYCEICNKSFDQRLLTIHKNMHQNVEEYNCSKCNRQFENSVSYEMHLQMHTETQGNSTKPQTIVPDLDIFGNAVRSNKKHACQYCAKEFQRPYEKVKHERIHTGEKPYSCEVCGKSFRVSYSLTLHLRTHTDIRPYVCATCNKRFKQQSVYVHHLKTHIAERQYTCDVCGKSFRTSVQLCGHRNSHSKPFSCTECNRPFASMYAVKLHMKTHNKPLKENKCLNRCDLCGASYSRLFALRFHLREQHGVEVEVDPGQLLDVETSNALSNKELDIETAILMNAANDAQLGNEEFMNDEHNEQCDLMGNGMSVESHTESMNQSLNRDVDLDETMAATQTILQNEEIIVDNFHPEEIITDWLK